jgi:hypothetical protein
MSTTAPSFATIAEHGLGTRVVDGTAWPVVNRVQVDRPAKGKPRWIVEIGLCNGTAAEMREFRTKREAIAYFEANRVHRGYVRDPLGTVYVQKPDDNQWGYSLFSEDQAWPGGFGIDTWEMVGEADVSAEDRERLGPVLAD